MDMKSLPHRTPGPAGRRCIACLSSSRGSPGWFAAGITILGVAILFGRRLWCYRMCWLVIPLTVTCTLGPQVAVSRSM